MCLKTRKKGIQGTVDAFDAVHLWFCDEATVGTNHGWMAKGREVIKRVGVANDKVCMLACFDGTCNGADAQNIGIDFGGGV